MSKHASDLPGVVSRELAAGLQPADQRLTGRTGSAQLAAQLAPEPIPFILFTAHTDRLPEPLATAAGDPLAFAELVRLLRQRALVRISADDLQLHRLVHTILRTRPGNGPDADAISRTALGLLRGAVPDDRWNNSATWPTQRQLLPHVLAATDTGRDVNPASGDASWLLDRASLYMHTWGEPRPARQLHERAFELRLRLLGDDQPAILASANNLAFVGARWVSTSELAN